MILGRSPREAALTMTVAELLLVLHRADRARARALLAATRSRYLASAAKWSKATGALFGKFCGELLAVADPAAAAAPPRKPSAARVRAAFQLLGIPAAPATS